MVLALVYRGPERNIRAKLDHSQDEKPRAQKKLGTQDETSTAIAAIKDNSRTIFLDREGNLKGISNFPPHLQETARLALQQQRVEIPAWVNELQGRSETLMGDSGSGVQFQLLKPVGEVVASQRPTFEWRPLKGATQYRVQIYDTNFHPITGSGPLKVTSWTAKMNIPRGGTYIWNVTAIRSGEEIVSPVPPAPEARFKVLEASSAEELSQLEMKDSHFLLGLAYLNAGLLAQAKAEFQQLAQQNPDSQRVKKILESLNTGRPTSKK